MWFVPILTYAYFCSVTLGTIADGNPHEIEKLVSRGSAGSIAAMDQLNPRIYVLGNEPWLGVQVKVSWDKLISMEANPYIEP